MKDLYNRTVREIALQYPISTRIFEEFRIDYCCGGKKPFEAACADAGVPVATVEEHLKELLANDSRRMPERFDRYTLSGLVDHILETHHAFTRDEISSLAPLMEKVAERHGTNHAALIELRELVLTLFAELQPHMEKEELVLFPYLKELDSVRTGGLRIPAPFGSVNGPISVMEAEHDAAGEILREMRGVTDDYELPPDACPSFTALFARLEALERDIHQHIHLENNILFPKAVQLESKIFRGVPG